MKNYYKGLPFLSQRLHYPDEIDTTVLSSLVVVFSFSKRMRAHCHVRMACLDWPIIS